MDRIATCWVDRRPGIRLCADARSGLCPLGSSRGKVHRLDHTVSSRTSCHEASEIHTLPKDGDDERRRGINLSGKRCSLIRIDAAGHECFVLARATLRGPRSRFAEALGCFVQLSMIALPTASNIVLPPWCCEPLLGGAESIVSVMQAVHDQAQVFLLAQIRLQQFVILVLLDTLCNGPRSFQRLFSSLEDIPKAHKQYSQ